MAVQVKSSGVERRAADVLLRASGGRTVQLRLPEPGVAGDTEQLGLGVPRFQDAELGPVVVLAASAKGTRQLLVSATEVDELVETLDYTTASVLFQAALGVLLDGVLFELLSVVESESKGVPYLYRLTLRAPVAQLL